MTGKAESAKKVAEANSKNFNSNEKFTITTYTGTRKVDTTPSDTNFYIKLEKYVPLIFFKVFGEKEGASRGKIFGDSYKLEIYVASKDGKLMPFPSANPEKDFNWTQQ